MDECTIQVRRVLEEPRGGDALRILADWLQQYRDLDEASANRMRSGAKRMAGVGGDDRRSGAGWKVQLLTRTDPPSFIPSGVAVTSNCTHKFELCLDADLAELCRPLLNSVLTGVVSVDIAGDRWRGNIFLMSATLSIYFEAERTCFVARLADDSRLEPFAG